MGTIGLELLDELDGDSVLEELNELVVLDDGSTYAELNELSDSLEDIGVDCDEEDNSVAGDDMNDVDVSDDVDQETDHSDDVL